MGSAKKAMLPTLVPVLFSLLPSQSFSFAQVSSSSSLLLVAGGHSNNSFSVEVWPPLLPECTLPPLPNERWGPSLDVHDDRPVLCGLSTCWQLAAGGWVDLAHTLHSRWYHSTA